MLAGVDLDLEAHPDGGLVFRAEAVDEGGPSLAELSPGNAQPGIENGSQAVERLPDGFRADLHQVDVLGVAGGRHEVELVEGRPATEEQALRQPRHLEDLDERTADHEVLFDLRVGRPRCVRPPLGDLVPGDHRSGSTSAFTISFQAATRRPPAVFAARRSGV